MDKEIEVEDNKKFLADKIGSANDSFLPRMEKIYLTNFLKKHTVK